MQKIFFSALLLFISTAAISQQQSKAELEKEAKDREAAVKSAIELQEKRRAEKKARDEKEARDKEERVKRSGHLLADAAGGG